MKKQFRLSLKRDFKNVFDNGRTVSLAELVLKFYPNKLKFPRIAIIISKKVAPKATKRNLIKRRIKAILQPTINNLPNFDLIFITKPELAKKDFAELKDIITGLIKKSKITK